MLKHTKLIAELEAGPGSREMGDRCLLAVGWSVQWRYQTAEVWCPPGGGDDDWVFAAPNPTTSLGAAIRWMVPEGARWDVQQDRTCAWASVDGAMSQHKTSPALALCIASLRARESDTPALAE